MAASKLPNKRFTLIEVLGMLGVGDGPDKACNIAIIPQNEKDAIISDCDSDGSDMAYEGEMGHLPARILNAHAELLETDDDRNKTEYGVVTMATNGQQMEKSYAESVVKRWNKERHAFDQVRQPQCIKQYNEHMGGVDLHDQQASRYSITIRSKKWLWPIFAWSLNSALVNSYYFYRDVMGGTIHLLTFTRVVAQSLIQRFGTKPLSHGRRSLLATTVRDQARYDQVSHWPVNTGNRFLRCRL
ncbi:piggyBac transposable element-derived protein 3-like [Perca fluviatilis]|uniref:piggyBac transposable element-derived protein 3-like n=1 Tax=Perca fluviatilis TaxID=8168 RepID=UPI0019640113|nr:piggyBac transposable element-derived protein 3-like [Perca fluviatilis]